jgi:uncharacterized protein (TIGR00369 family)
MSPGHPVGDFIGGPDWKVLEQAPGHYRVEAALPERVLNPLGILFGGFTPAFADMIALLTAHTMPTDEWRWLRTVNMRVDYFEPIEAKPFIMDAHVVTRRGKTLLVEVRFEDHAGTMLAFAITTLREV